MTFSHQEYNYYDARYTLRKISFVRIISSVTPLFEKPIRPVFPSHLIYELERTNTLQECNTSPDQRGNVINNRCNHFRNAITAISSLLPEACAQL